MATQPAWHAVLRGLREARGLTQEGWAVRLGYSRRTLVRWERGDAVPDAAAEDALIALCREQDLFRHYDHGPLAGCTVTVEWLRTLLAAARLGPAADTGAAPAVDVGGGSAAATNLPESVASFVGREQELADIVRLLTSGRILTLTGTAGTGKTRLALQAASALAAAFPDGVWFVDLAPLHDPTALPSAVAQVLGVQEIPDTPLRESVLRVVRHKRMLLVLDNYEHLLAAAEFADALLRAGPGPTVLVTSRAPLRIPGEREYGVPPLPLPPATPASLGEVADNPAVALFVQRAQAVQADFRLTAENAAAVAAVCIRLDGLPLAIELAAARVKVLPPAALLARMERRLPLLVGGARTLPQRQQTLRDTIQWSWDLLPPPEQVLFRRLAVFAGGFTLKAAEAVCSPDGELDVLEGLAALVDQSLVQHGERAGEARFSLLATLREFALEQLDAAGEGEALRRAHADYYSTLAEAADAAWWRSGRMQQELLRPLDAEWDNLIAALGWALATQDAAVGLRLGGALGWWFRCRAPGEGDRWLQQLLALPEAAPPSAARGRALFAAGLCAEARGGYQGGVRYWEEAAACLRVADDLPALSRTLALLGACLPTTEAERALAIAEEALRLGRVVVDTHDLAWVVGLVGEALLTHSGNRAAAREHIEEALRLGRAQNADWMVMWALDMLGVLAMTEGQPAEARARLREALPLAEAVGDGGNVNAIGVRLAVLAATAGDQDEATVHWHRALVSAQEQGLARLTASPLAGIAGLLAAQQRFEPAVQLLAASDRLWQVSLQNVYNTSLFQMAFTQARAATEGGLSPAAFAQAWAAGEALSLDQATDLALAELASLPPPTHPLQTAGA
jgi:predicted ATPase/DNA-binding XRE family transcriptional regulator